jgi:hypothetical protein
MVKYVERAMQTEPVRRESGDGEEEVPGQYVYNGRPYGELMRLMDLLRAAGYLKVALVDLEGVDAPSGEVDDPLVARPESQR